MKLDMYRVYMFVIVSVVWLRRDQTTVLGRSLLRGHANTTRNGLNSVLTSTVVQGIRNLLPAMRNFEKPKEARNNSNAIHINRQPTFATTGSTANTSASSGTTNTSSGSGANNDTTPLTNRLMDIIQCGNQTRCITPELSLTQHYQVHICKHDIPYGIRFYFMILEGVLLHPKLQLVDHPDHADINLFLVASSQWKQSECNHRHYWNKTILLDESDQPTLFVPEEFKQVKPPANFLMIFKRSYIHRYDGEFEGYANFITANNIFPMAYSITEAYVSPHYHSFAQRSLKILCTLRKKENDPVRQRVRDWVDEYQKIRNISNVIAGALSKDKRDIISKSYFESMYSAQIVVTANPSYWEGDFRLCEALASGALIFVDHMYVPNIQPFEANQHLIYYSNKNKTDLFTKLDQFFFNSDAATSAMLLKQRQHLAMHGYVHAMKHHRAANLVDYIFRTLHTYQRAVGEGNVTLLTTDFTYLKSFSHYQETGYHLRFNAIRNQKQYEKILKTSSKKLCIRHRLDHLIDDPHYMPEACYNHDKKVDEEDDEYIDD